MEERYISVNDVNLWTILSGNGPPVVLCHGGPGACDYLGPVAGMIDDNFTVIRYEQRGCGRSTGQPPYTVQSMISDLESLRQSLGFEKWIVGGHSWGANLSLAYAMEYPNAVNAVVYIAGTGITMDWKPEFECAKSFHTELIPEYPYPLNEEINKLVWSDWYEFIKTDNLKKRIRKLKMPVLIMHGEKDLRPSWPSYDLAALLKNATYTEIPEAEHYIWMMSYELMKNHLRSFLKRLNLQTQVA